ncbi:MAG: nitroreductase family protein [Elusimicrobia bacterium]|nr:nitroreductase family protein [Elusimicrobiota bacterium]
MEFYETIRARRSVRSYKPDPVPQDVLRRVLEAFQAAPSWANTQAWEVILVADQDAKARLQATLSERNPSRGAMLEAPVVVAAIGIEARSGFYKGQASTPRGDWLLFDLGIATEHLCLAAAAEGLGTVHVAYFDSAKAGEILGVPAGRTVVELIPLGFPAKTPDRVPRKGLKEFVFKERHGAGLTLALAAALLGGTASFAEDTASDAKKSAPKRAAIYVSPSMSFRERGFTHDVREDERNSLILKGYQVEVRDGTTANILEDLWEGVSAVSYFGHGGYEDANGDNNPTLAGLTAEAWKELVTRDFTVRYQLEQGKDLAEAARLASARAENLGLELMRNNSCFGLYNHSLAFRFVKPGGLYYGAKRWVSPTTIGQGLADTAAQCLPNGTCTCVAKLSAAHLTEYRVPEKPTEGVGISDAACSARAGRLMRVLQDWSGEGRRPVYDPDSFWKTVGPDQTAARLKLGRHLKMEDGTVEPVRTGREEAFYNKVKEALLSDPKPGSIGMEELLRMGLDSTVRTDGAANLQETFLTIHNVMRLLARPQQWAGGGMDTDYGHRSTDPAWPVLQDLRGAMSSGGRSLPDALDARRQPNGSLMDPTWSLRLFDPDTGPFQPQPGAINREWNAGCHYYQWIGATAHSTLGALAVSYGAWAETGVKQSQDKAEQGSVEVSHFICGSKFAAEAFKDRRGGLAPQPPAAGKPDCEALNPDGKGLGKGQFYAALRVYQDCLKGYRSSPGLPVPDMAADPKKACVACVDALITGPCYVRVATLAGWGLCLTCDKGGGVDPKDRFVEKDRCPMCSGVSWSLCDFKPAPANCVALCSTASDPCRKKAGDSRDLKK